MSAAIYDSALEREGGRRIESRFSVRSAEVLVALYESPPYDLQVDPMDIGRLSINLAAVPVFGGIASSRSGSYRGRRYSLFHTPAGSDAHWSKPRHSRHLNIYFTDALIEELADGQEALLRRDRPLLDVHVHKIKPWIDALELSIREPGPFSGEAVLDLAHLIVAKLVGEPTRGVQLLKPAVLARLRNYVIAHLGDKIRVRDLAAMTNLPTGRFVLCFKASTGVTPHQFVISRRIEAAMRLLENSSFPMAEVAATCGFSSQQHMATLIRKVVGVVPSSVRRRP